MVKIRMLISWMVAFLQPHPSAVYHNGQGVRFVIVSTADCCSRYSSMSKDCMFFRGRLALAGKIIHLGINYLSSLPIAAAVQYMGKNIVEEIIQT